MAASPTAMNFSTQTINLDYVSEDDDFTIALLERPTFLRAELSFLLCFLQGLGEYVDTTDLRQSKAVFKLDI